MEGSGSRQTHEIGVTFCPFQDAPDKPGYDCFSLTGPFGCVVVADPLPGFLQRKLVENLVSLCLENGVHVHHGSRAQLASVAVPVGSAPTATFTFDFDFDAIAKGRAIRHEKEMVTSSQLVEPSRCDAEEACVEKGDNVEVLHQGEWVSGVLQGVQGEFALVSCYSDDPGTITVAPLRKVRAASYDRREALAEQGFDRSVSQ